MIFAAVMFTLFTVELLTPVQEHVIVPFTTMLARTTAAIIAPFDSSVASLGKILYFNDSDFSVSIEAGCNGVEAMIVLVSAIIAYPASWRARLVAIVLGFLAVQAMNILRIVSLFYLGEWNIAIFTWVHLYLWPVLIMLDVLIVFMFYVSYQSGNTSGKSQPNNA